jgi:cell fate regulator YaaT (PSP1 superfamily)
MPIIPLPQFEADLKEHLDAEDKKTYDALQVPKTVVVRFGSMKLIGEFPYDLKAKPGCGSKLVVRTFRGTELGEMLTSTCPNSGCSKSVSRQDMLKYIENSGGKDYPFFTDGRVVRIATAEDIQVQSRIEQGKHEMNVRARSVVARMGLDVKIVEIEPILGGERITAYYLSEHRLELHHVARELSTELRLRVDMRQVGARDEARLIADYEKCGQYCCCKSFLKVLKPVSMKAAKTQKATLEPLKISGRCGRLMCCLRYEEQTYDDLKARLPRRKSRVGTPEGDGMVIDSQILTQLVLVELDELDGATGQIKTAAVAVEDLSEPKSKVPPVRPAFDAMPMRGGDRRGPRPGAPSAGGPPRRDSAPPSAPAATGDAPKPAPPQDRAPDRGQERRPDRGQDRGQEKGQDRSSRPTGRPDQRSGPRRDGPQNPQGRPPQNRNQPPQSTGPVSTPAQPANGAGPADTAREGSDEVIFDDNGNEVTPDRGGPGESGNGPGGQGDRRRRRRRRGRGGGGGGAGGGGGGGGSPSSGPPGAPPG